MSRNVPSNYRSVFAAATLLLATGGMALPQPALAGTATTETFTYTAPTGGMTNGAVTIDVPAGWTAPQLDVSASQGATETLELAHNGFLSMGAGA